MSDASRPTLARRAFPGLLFVLLVVAVYSPTMFSRRNFAGRDLLVYHLPIEKAVHDAYSRGSLPVWIAEISGGRPLAANPNVGAFYPVRPLLALLPFPVAMRIFPVLHWVIAGLGMILLLRSLGASRSAAWIGAVTYAFSGPSVTEVFFPNIHPGMTLLPWVVWAIQRRTGSDANRCLTLSVVFGLLFLAGDVFTIGIAIAASAFWIVLERDRAERLREMLLLIVSMLLAGLLAAPQIVAAALWVPDTNRAILGMRLRDALFFSVSPLRLLEFVIPFPFGPTWSLENARIWGWPVFQLKTIGFFTTLFAGSFSVIALTASWRWRPRGARFARALFVGALSAAVLPSFLPSAWEALPSPIPLRFPEKFAVGVVFALAILSGLAFDRFRGVPRPPRWILVVGLVIAGLALAAALFPHLVASAAVTIVGEGPRLERPPEALREAAGAARRELPAALAEGAVLWIATAAALALLPQGRRGIVGAIVLLTLVPLASNRRIARTVTEERLFGPTPFTRFLDRRDPAHEYRTLGESFYRAVSPMEIAQSAAEPEGGGQSWVQYRQVLFGRGTVFNFDFDAGDFARVESLRRISSVMASTSAANPFFGNLGLRFGIRFRDQDALPGYLRVGGSPLLEWDELPGALPDVRLVETWREETGPLEAARAVPELAAGEIVVESGVQRRGRARPGTLRVLTRTANTLRLETETPDPTWLFVVRGFWGYRDVQVDGRSIESVPAQLGFSALPLPSGRHLVEWNERLPGSEVSRWGPVVFILLIAGLFAREGRRGG
jgi:hypothetical protein